MKKLGVQLYTIRDYMQDEENIRNSFKRLKAIGIDQAQTAGCAIPYEDFGRIAKEEGIEIVGTHDNFTSFVEDFEAAFHRHELLGTKIMGMGGAGFIQTAEGIEAFLKDANEVCRKVGEKGGKFTFHNHSHEFVLRDNGKTMMDMLYEGLDKEYGSFCLDTYWVQHGGGDVRAWMEKLAGRIDILHLKDMGRLAASNPNDGWQYITEIGRGQLYWEGIIKTAEEIGVKYYVIEQDGNWMNGDPFESLKISVDYLSRFMK
ncbi:MAG: sugar phosphate isomerase/epimerase [Clostridia bacterium]|nr:sugar phosphate isomerase/epimerase [Clostridia bacterium]